MIKSVYLIFFIFLSSVSLSQEPNFRLLCIASGPGYEDGAALAYYSYRHGYDTYTVFLTNGKSGKHEIYPQSSEERAAVREQESQDAADLLNSDIYFVKTNDLDDTKTKADSLMARLVFMIRAIEADVIITDHDTIMGISISDAIVKAADRNYYPEQLSIILETWATKKHFFKVSGSQKTDVNIDITKKTSYGETIKAVSIMAFKKYKTVKIDDAQKESVYTKDKCLYKLAGSDEMHLPEEADLFYGLTPDVRGDPIIGRY